MKKTMKKATAVGLVLTSVASLAACGTDSNKSSSAAASKEITKPDKFTVMMDGTVVTLDNGGQDFRDQLEEATGLKGAINWVQPDHSGYYDQVANAFQSNDTMPDVVILSGNHYTSYASNGFLWDMTDAWNNSATKASGRLVTGAVENVEALKTPGVDGVSKLYAFTPARGNGCVTYVKSAWLKTAGYNPDDVANKTLTFSEYYDMLKKLKEGHSYVISTAGFIGNEAPWTNYLPEFYQQAQYDFTQDSTGKWVDGFQQQAMKDALQRIQTAVNEGIIDKETINNSTSNARDKFYSSDKAAESGVFTYWAGTWMDTLESNLKSHGLDSELIELKPIKEMGSYVERVAPAWAITTHATNPEGIFKYFLDTMLDGGDVQTLWCFGAKGTHWDTKAETVTLQGKDTGTEYKEGEFHYLPSPQKPSTLNKKNHIDTLLMLANFKDKNPAESVLSKVALTSQQFFADNSKVTVNVPATPEYTDNITDINTARKKAVADVALNGVSVNDAMATYTKTVGSAVETVAKSLNAAAK